MILKCKNEKQFLLEIELWGNPNYFIRKAELKFNWLQS